MSLDVYLEVNTPQPVKSGSGIYIREDGCTKEISRAEWDRRYPDREPVVVTNLPEESHEVYRGNITHNLTLMAAAAGIYTPLWRPEEIGVAKASQLIPLLRDGLATLQTDPEKYRVLNPKNGWGNYEGLLRFVASYLNACEANPEASVRVWR